MVRTAGSKNKPKTTEELMDAVNKQLASEGKKVIVVDDKGVPSTHTAKEVPNIFEVEEEKDTYKCGACGAELDSDVSECPKCHAKLTW